VQHRGVNAAADAAGRETDPAFSSLDSAAADWQNARGGRDAGGPASRRTSRHTTDTRAGHLHAYTADTQLGRDQYTDIAKFAGHLPHRYGNSRAVWDHTVLPATRQRPLPQPKLVLD